MSNTRVVIFGASGLVGSERFGFDKTREIITPDEKELDTRWRQKIIDFINKKKPQSIILLAAYTDVDGAERERELAWQINVVGAQNVAWAAQKQNSFLIYISTDYVFPGTKDSPGPYSEEEVPLAKSADRGWYAETKLQGERAVLKSGGKTAIVRLAFPFGNTTNPRDYSRKILAAFMAGYPLFADQRLTPTFIPDLWQALDKIERDQKRGVWHVATKPVTTPYEFGSYLVGKLGLEKEVKQGSLVEFLKGPGVAPRYFFGGLKTEKTEKELGLTFHRWQEAILEVIPELKSVLANQGGVS